MCASAGIDNNLPSDITEEILCRLPAKSLGRFKSVSKTWNSLISDPRFIKNNVHQTQNNEHKTTNLICSRFIVSTKELLPLPNIPVAAKKLSLGSPPISLLGIWGSCNGLLLAYAYLRDMVLINPTTWEFWDVPSPPLKYEAPCYGFGYDSFTDDYKVVSITDTEKPYLHASVYSLRKNSWKILPNSPLEQDDYDLCSGALVNNIYHWAGTRSIILAFSLADEVFNVIKLPRSFKDYDVVELGGKLGVFLMLADGYKLWVMQEYTNCKSWTRVWSMSNSVLSKKFEVLHTPVCFVEGSNRGIMMVSTKSGILVFNIDDRRYRTVQIEGGKVIYEGTFVESIETLARFVTTP